MKDLKKGVVPSILFFLCCLGIFSGCDPVFPQGDLDVVLLNPLPQGTSTEIEIIYPSPPGSIIFYWKNQNVEIINGEDIVAVSELSVTGRKPGTALLRVNATAYCTPGGEQEIVYSTEVEIKVE